MFNRSSSLSLSLSPHTTTPTISLNYTLSTHIKTSAPLRLFHKLNQNPHKLLVNAIFCLQSANKSHKKPTFSISIDKMFLEIYFGDVYTELLTHKTYQTKKLKLFFVFLFFSFFSFFLLLIKNATELIECLELYVNTVVLHRRESWYAYFLRFSFLKYSGGGGNVIKRAVGPKIYIFFSLLIPTDGITLLTTVEFNVYWST